MAITEDYKLKLKNSNLIQLLLDKDNISPLESILDSESQYLKTLQKLKNNDMLDFGPKLDDGNLEAVLFDIKGEVDNFLGASDINQPSCEYYSLFKLNLGSMSTLFLYGLGAFLTIDGFLNFPCNPFNTFLGLILLQQAALIHTIEKTTSHYDLLTKSITMSPLYKHRVDVIPVVGHEYAHHVQRKRLSLPVLSRCSYFEEGHARGVQRFIANRYRDKENNEAFMYNYLDLSVAELKATYKWMCKKLGIGPRESLLKVETEARHKKQSSHSIGNTLFSLYETRLGDGIYKDLINGSFEFKKIY